MRRIGLAIRPGVWVAAVAMLVTGGVVAMPATPAMAATGCVTQNFSTANEGTFLQCVQDAQVLLNNVRNELAPLRPDIATDGHYGPQTAGDVGMFQLDINNLNGANTLAVDEVLGPHTWVWLCAINEETQHTGAFWHDAGCATTV
jgi:hypothetical protein